MTGPVDRHAQIGMMSKSERAGRNAKSAVMAGDYQLQGAAVGSDAQFDRGEIAEIFLPSETVGS